VTIYKDDLMRVRQLIEKPENWTQRYSSVNASGEPVEPDDPAACRWCIEAACRKVMAPMQEYQYFSALIDLWPTRLAPHLDNDSIGVTHAEVLSLLDRAIERAQERP
jgi:hypothetical protein